MHNFGHVGTIGQSSYNEEIGRFNWEASDRVFYIASFWDKFRLIIANKGVFNENYPILSEVDIFVQIACPRISIDWGMNFVRPLITPYELYVVLGEVEWKTVYPMDYYSNSGGQWTNYYHK